MTVPFQKTLFHLRHIPNTLLAQTHQLFLGDQLLAQVFAEYSPVLLAKVKAPDE